MQQAVQPRWREGRQYKQDSGFTIVELLIVIIVIATLALIVITTYNGVQTRVKNTKTVAAVAAWAKAIHLYHADTGDWPTQYSCLGDTDTYSGGACQQTGSPHVDAAFENDIRPYLGGGAVPEPDVSLLGDPDGTWRRGALYSPSGPRIWFALGDSESCPDLSGLYGVTATTILEGGRWCRGDLSDQ